MEEFLANIYQYISVELLIHLVIRFIEIIMVIILTKVAIILSYRFVDSLLSNEKGRKKYISDRRRRTLKMLLKSILRYGIYFFSGMIILSLLNVPVTSLLAGAGIIGVALGFGAQSLVRDIINGFFILFEDQFGVGDYIKTADVDGIVEEIGLRTTSIRSFGGELHIIPNGEINQVTNYSVGNMRVMVDVSVSYKENPSQVIEVLDNLCTLVAREKADFITEGPTVLGIQELASSAMVFRIWARTKPMEQWHIGRYIRKRVKEIFDETEIEIPYPHMVLLTKEPEGVVKNEQ